MKRSNISGFEITLFGYTVEVVTVNHVPRCLAVWTGRNLIKRLEA